MNIWIVAPEFAPYVTLGGIGTGLRGFALALLRRGHRVTVVIPVMRTCPADLAQIDEVWLDEAYEENGLRLISVGIAEVDDQFRGYGTDVSQDPRAARRSGLFSQAVVECIVQAQQSEKIDVVHAHEWPAAMIPYLLREKRIRLATVFTIHSLAYQGFFPTTALSWFGLGPEHATMERLELYGRISLLKGGVLAANQVTTVSPTYAREIQTPEQGHLLDGVFRKRGSSLTGIVNGIDTLSWNPARDPALPERFDAHNVSGKKTNKEIFCLQHKLDVDKPLFVSLGRLVEQKGIDILGKSIPHLVEMGANVCLAGSGDAEIEALCASAAQVFPGRVVYLGYVTDDNARRLLAAGDFLLMPSRWEPCGIVQLQAMRYGVVPIARRTGGLADTIIDAEDRLAAANGFLFDELSVRGLVQVISRALSRLGTPEFGALQKRGMLAAHGWEGPVRAYEMVYRAALR